MKVCKFGGSSVATADQIRKVRMITEEDRDRTVIVVSAPGKRNPDDEKITDMLYECEALRKRGESIESVYERISSRYRDIAEGLELGRDAVDSELLLVKNAILEGRGRAYCASRGEYLSALLISKYLGWNFLDSEGVIVIGDDNRIEDITYTTLREKIGRGGKYVIPGFYGTSLSGDIVTFSRGGSDITGAIVSAAVDADVYENWTDVSGVYSSDPRLVKNARVIDNLSYTEVREFSEVGASVFHEEAIAPCIDKKIPVNIRNTNSPSDRGTFIREKTSHRGAVGVSGKGDLSRVRVRRLMLFKERSILERILSRLSEYGIRPSYTFYGSDSVSWYFETKSAGDCDYPALAGILREEFSLDEAELEKGYAVVGIVGSHIDETMEYADALSSLREKSIHPVSLSLGGSAMTFLIALEEKRKNEAVSVISERIFG